jgi:hypothetical protein
VKRQLAPEATLRAALHVLFVAAYTTRNWTFSDEVTRQQIHDLWQALHEIPDLVTRWREGSEDELLRYLDEYDAKWPQPRLRVIYDQAIGDARA